MFIRLRYHTPYASQNARQWNPSTLSLNGHNSIINTSGHTGKSQNHVVMFKAKTEPDFPITWLGAKQNQILTILLTHYNPLRKVEQNLPPGQKLEELLQQHNALPKQYQKHIISFYQEMQTLSQRFNLNINQWANNADLIICCWGEFMESPYQHKHIFQGQSFGKVFIYNTNSNIIGIQSRPCY